MCIIILSICPLVNLLFRLMRGGQDCLKPHEKIFAANEEVQNIRLAFDKIKESISLAQKKYKRVVDKHRKSLEFQEDDWVLL